VRKGLTPMPASPAARELSVIADGPAIEGITPAVYVIPTDAPEADGTLAWNETTVVLVAGRNAGHRPCRHRIPHRRTDR
jgi:hypothetical protein